MIFEIIVIGFDDVNIILLLILMLLLFGVMIRVNIDDYVYFDSIFYIMIYLIFRYGLVWLVKVDFLIGKLVVVVDDILDWIVF